MVSFHPSVSGASNTSCALRSGVRQLRKMDAARQPGRERDRRVIDAFTVIGDEQGITTPISAALEASNIILPSNVLRLIPSASSALDNPSHGRCYV